VNPPHHGGASDTLDELRTLIIRDDSGLAPEDITMLGRVEGWLHHLELMQVSRQDRHRIRDTREGEWPEVGQEVHCWRADEWEPHTYSTEWSMRSHLWLPAPPHPEEL
jgi:hypothetical protein